MDPIKKQTMKKMFYFGCIGQAGHYFWINEREKVHHYRTFDSRIPITFPMAMDGIFVPGDTNRQGVYKESLVPPCRIIAWHDYTGDSRPGSNSALIGIGYESADEMLADAINHFPTVMKRQTAPLHRINYESTTP